MRVLIQLTEEAAFKMQRFGIVMEGQGPRVAVTASPGEEVMSESPQGTE